MRTHYLDHNATTPLKREAFEVMMPFLKDDFGNASSVHAWGRRARAAIDDAREEIAACIGAKAKELVFTSGGTESNNLALFGAARSQRARGRRIVTCATEHHAVLHPCKALEAEGFEIITLPVDAQGHINLDQLRTAISDGTILVSLMSANNETGTRHPIETIGRMCRERSVLFHCDAVQSFGKEPISVEAWNCDLLSLAAHKFYGPKGAGILYVRSSVRLQPLQLGGFHENERRAGTENVASIAGAGCAASLSQAKTASENQRLFELTEMLWKELSSLDGIRRNGDPVRRLGNTLNVSFEECDGESLLMAMDLAGLAVSSGSACMVGSIQPSHVLQAMDLPEKLIRATVRFSLGASNEKKDIPEIAATTRNVVGKLRKRSKSQVAGNK